ncbi:MAG TPA: PD-(D/E)XK nuclease family protein [Candidatus Wunengus sp. YC61]|uniref:PD-(D/E)XK nuclease family protein n=1 Tax=Candidatus Wunengus sp. YC61 TaxID=3367698 RepID=UPI004025A899
MPINVLPSMPLKPLTRISPSRYSALRLCALREIRTAGSQPPLLPISPSARLGMTAHKLLELTFSGQLKDEESMLHCWENEIRNHELEMKNNILEKHLVPLALNTSNYKVKQIMTFNIVRILLREFNIQTKKVRKAETELWVQTKDEKIGGKIDSVKYADDGIYIIDYKTGAITNYFSNDNSVKEEYQEQLKIYAGLYYESHGVWPVKLILIGLDKSEYNIPFNHEECLNLLNDAKSHFDKLNKLITSGLDSTDFAAPSQAACRYCVYRPACKIYWVKRQDMDNWPTDFIGTVKDKKILGNGLFKVVLENKEKRVTIRGLSPERNIFLSHNVREAMFCNLGNDTTPGYFKELPMTTGYKLQ